MFIGAFELGTIISIFFQMRKLRMGDLPKVSKLEDG